MGNRLYVGNLSFNTSEAELRQEFGKCGSVTDAKIVIDRETGRSRGFAFVQYATEGEATTAIQALNGALLGGRALTVNVAVDRPRDGSGGGPRNFGGGAPRPNVNSGGYNNGGGYSSGPPNDRPSGGGGKGRGGGKGSRRRREDNDNWG